jgi:hypothetical protein
MGRGSYCCKHRASFVLSTAALWECREISKGDCVLDCPIETESGNTAVITDSVRSAL